MNPMNIGSIPIASIATTMGMNESSNLSITINILLYHNPTYPNCFFEYTAVNSITSDKNSSIQIVPNPVTGTSTILTSNDLRNNTSCKFELYNLLGTCVKRFSFSTNSTLSKNDIAPGMYYYIVRVQDRIINTGKVIVE